MHCVSTNNIIFLFKIAMGFKPIAILKPGASLLQIIQFTPRIRNFLYT